jgi:hypothetical protein
MTTRFDATQKTPTIAEMQDAYKRNSANAWKNAGDMAHVATRTDAYRTPAAPTAELVAARTDASPVAQVGDLRARYLASARNAWRGPSDDPRHAPAMRQPTRGA